MFNNLIYFICLFFIIGYSILIVESVYYVEMTPYEDYQCTVSKGENGVGYAFIVGECFAIGDFTPTLNNYKITLGKDNANATFQLYKSSDITCSNLNPEDDVTYFANECYKVPDIGDMYFQPYNYVLVTIKENPTSMPEYAYKYSQFTDPNCLGNPQWYYFYTNNTVFHFGNNSFSKFYCDQGEPLQLYCEDYPTNCTTGVELMTCGRNVFVWHEDVYSTVSC
ncbi:hypothetical protein ACTFIZ_009490 [Dictyostelium cf. discoideum]